MRSLPDSIRDAGDGGRRRPPPDDVTLTLGGANAQVVWGSAEDSAMKALVLEKAMAARPPAVGERLRRLVAERDRRALTRLARAFRAVPGRMSRHAATLPAGAVASAYFRDSRNCIPGNSLHLY